MSAPPTLRFERSLLREGANLLIGMDEVGRGALSGPVSVGVVAVSLGTKSAPQGLRDSKLISPAVRESLAPRIRRWAIGHAVGHAWPGEIDAIGILPALRLAGLRAMSQLEVRADLVLLDGNHDWLGRQYVEQALFDCAPDGSVRTDPVEIDEPEVAIPPVITRVKADMTCAAVAAASVLAKVERDRIMAGLAEECPAYGWQVNKGYATSDHQEALRTAGPSVHHRRSWNLPGWEASA